MKLTKQLVEAWRAQAISHSAPVQANKDQRIQDLAETLLELWATGDLVLLLFEHSALLGSARPVATRRGFVKPFDVVEALRQRVPSDARQ